MKNKFFNQFSIVLKKELKDAFRDKKSIFATFILPLILFPIFFVIIGMSSNSITDKAINPKLTIVTTGTESSLSVNSQEYKYFEEMNFPYIDENEFHKNLI